ncbi:cupredoxin domain-containing protein [Candidatus Woesearchaeota archaeon]|nr:cupredoxin domain-containing protein [Candidatus Woesearchaeota archaeon]
MKNTISATIIAIVIFSKDTKNAEDVKAETITSNVLVEDGIQVIQVVSTGGGYSPRTTNAKANIETVLRINSENSYGCERSFRIPQLDINEILPTNGITEIELGSPKAGEEIFGSCSMGMYTFTINFN